MKKYIPYPAFPEDVPIDLSYLYEGERPAGKHGFLQATDDYFTFEDGTPGRFWGVNINGSANFPEHSYSEIFAKRLMKVGISWTLSGQRRIFFSLQRDAEKVILAALTNKAWSGLTIWSTA